MEEKLKNDENQKPLKRKTWKHTEVMNNHNRRYAKYQG